MKDLTDRQNLICRLICAAKLDKQIAAELGISEDLLRYHIKAIFRKTGVKSRTELTLHFLLLSHDAVARRLEALTRAEKIVRKPKRQKTRS
jgi:DNA-binding CsgD family transcriptional regulator